MNILFNNVYYYFIYLMHFINSTFDYCIIDHALSCSQSNPYNLL